MHSIAHHSITIPKTHLIPSALHTALQPLGCVTFPQHCVQHYIHTIYIGTVKGPQHRILHYGTHTRHFHVPQHCTLLHMCQIMPRTYSIAPCICAHRLHYVHTALHTTACPPPCRSHLITSALYILHCIH